MPLSVRLFLVLGLGLLPAIAGRADDKPPEVTYYPITVGTIWHNKTENGKLTFKVVSHEKVGEQMCARIEVAFDGKPACYEHIAVKPEGIYRYSFNGIQSKEPVRLLKLPPKKGDTWPVEVKAGSETLKGTFKVDEEEIKVPAGTYKTFVATLKDAEGMGAPKLSCTYWFAAGVGIVKQEFKIGNQATTVELEKFEPKAAESK